MLLSWKSSRMITYVLIPKYCSKIFTCKLLQNHSNVLTAFKNCFSCFYSVIRVFHPKYLNFIAWLNFVGWKIQKSSCHHNPSWMQWKKPQEQHLLVFFKKKWKRKKKKIHIKWIFLKSLAKVSFFLLCSFIMQIRIFPCCCLQRKHL